MAALLAIVSADVVFFSAIRAYGYSDYPPAALLQPGDITGTIIRDGTITDVDVSSAAAISADKVASTTNKDFVTSSTQTYTGVKTFASLPVVPAGTPTGNQVVGQNYLASVIPVSTIGVTTGELISTSSAVYVENSANTTSSVWNNGASTGNECAFNYGVSSTNSGAQCATSFHLSTGVTTPGYQITASKINYGQPVFAIFLVPDNNGKPSTTILASSSVNGTTFGTSPTATTTNWNVPYMATANGTYWIVASTTAASDNTNFMRIQGGSTCTAGYIAKIGDSAGAWVTAADSCFYMNITINHSAGLLYRTSAANASTSNAFIGFSNGTYEASTTATIGIVGPMNIFSGLVAGYQYYLANSPGAVSSTAGTVTRKAGISYSATGLVITNVW